MTTPIDWLNADGDHLVGLWLQLTDSKLAALHRDRAILNRALGEGYSSAQLGWSMVEFVRNNAGNTITAFVTSLVFEEMPDELFAAARLLQELHHEPAPREAYYTYADLSHEGSDFMTAEMRAALVNAQRELEEWVGQHRHAALTTDGRNGDSGGDSPEPSRLQPGRKRWLDEG